MRKGLGPENGSARSLAGRNRKICFMGKNIFNQSKKIGHIKIRNETGS